MPCASPLATYLLASLIVLPLLSCNATTTYPSELNSGDGRASITATRFSKLISLGLVDALETPVILVVVMVKGVVKPVISVAVMASSSAAGAGIVVAAVGGRGTGE